MTPASDPRLRIRVVDESGRTSFAVERGTYSPQTGVQGWAFWDVFDDLPSAMHAARRLGWARIIRQQLVHTYEDGKLQRKLKTETKMVEGEGP